MAGGINFIGQNDSFQQMRQMTSANMLGAQATGTAKKNIENLESEKDQIRLSDKAAMSLAEEQEEVQEQNQNQNQSQKAGQDDQKVQQQRMQQAKLFSGTFSEDEKEINEKNNANDGETDFEKMQKFMSQGNEHKMMQQRMQNVAGFAAMSLGSKDKAETQKSEKSSESPAPSAKGQASEASSGSGGLTDTQQLLEDLQQAGALGIFEAEAKKMKEKESLQEVALQTGLIHEEVVKQERTVVKEGASNEIKIDRVRAEDIERVMNRTPEEILAGVPEQFKATAKIMVAGQVDAVGTPKETLVAMKNEPRVESAALELMPADYAGEIELAEGPDSIPTLMEAPVEAEV